MLNFKKYLATEKLRQLLNIDNASRVVSDDELALVVDAINEETHEGQVLSQWRLAEIIETSIDGLTVSTEGISNQDLDTLLVLARKSQQ